MVGAGDDASIPWGKTFTRSGSFTDPGADTWAATVDYGDGTGEQALPLDGKNFSLSHTYDSSHTGNNIIAIKVSDDDGGTGSDVLTVNVTPVTISDFSCSGKTDVTATFSFAAPTGAAAVKVLQSTDGGTTWQDSSTVTLTASSTTATVTGLTPGTAYKFKLVVTGGSYAGESNAVSLTTDDNSSNSGSNGSNPSSGNTFPVTGSNIYWLIPLGLVLILAGAIWRFKPMRR